MLKVDIQDLKKYWKYYKGRKVSNMEDKKEKLPSTRIQCEKPIYINIDSSHWKYSLFNIEIFTFSYKREK